MKPLVQPQVNLNGTSRRELVDQQRAIINAGDVMLRAMANAMPHGRDYQFKPDEHPGARDAWIERIEALEALMKEIEDHALEIQRGGK